MKRTSALIMMLMTMLNAAVLWAELPDPRESLNDQLHTAVMASDWTRVEMFLHQPRTITDSPKKKSIWCAHV